MRDIYIIDQNHMQREKNISFEIPTTPPVRPSRPSPGRGTTTTTISSRSPHLSLRPPTQTAKTVSSPSPRTRYTLSKSPESLRTVTGTVTRPRAIQATVTKSSRMTTRTSPSPAVPPRVSDLDSVMAKTKTASPRSQPAKSIVKPSPLAENIRRSLFTGNVVKVVRPVRSQELKIFSCPSTDQSLSINVDQQAIGHSNTDESSSTLTAPSLLHDIESPTGNVPRDLSEDSLNEHHHIKQLLQTSNLTIFLCFSSLSLRSSRRFSDDERAFTSGRAFFSG